ELGFGDLETSGWAALYAPAKTPPAVVNKINAAVNKVLAMPEVEKKFSDLGVRPAGGTPQQLDKLAHTELERWRETVVNSNFVIE
ncbi:tripartite tricarboxylate transporter substrate-binding protein, partial [Staphylococcus aureus]|nr:tripartite tricarboxylate transporter substrate-binding protein [Staphylococcus aureus]